MYKLSPSKASRYLNCTMSLKFDKPFTSSPASIRGSLLHEIAEKRLKQQDTTDLEQENNLNEYELYLLETYMKAIESEMNIIQADQLIVEKKDPILLYGNHINLIIDALCLGKHIASIIDLKTGRNDVSPENNEQLMFYAYSVLSAHPKVKIFRLSIFQKCKLKTVEVTKDEVYDYFIDKADIFESIEKDELTFNPSDKACKYCGNKDTCLVRAEWIVGGKKDG